MGEYRCKNFFYLALGRNSNYYRNYRVFFFWRLDWLLDSQCKEEEGKNPG